MSGETLVELHQPTTRRSLKLTPEELDRSTVPLRRLSLKLPLDLDGIRNGSPPMRLRKESTPRGESRSNSPVIKPRCDSRSNSPVIKPHGSSGSSVSGSEISSSTESKSSRLINPLDFLKETLSPKSPKSPKSPGKISKQPSNEKESPKASSGTSGKISKTSSSESSSGKISKTSSSESVGISPKVSPKTSPKASPNVSPKRSQELSPKRSANTSPVRSGSPLSPRGSKNDDLRKKILTRTTTPPSISLLEDIVVQPVPQPVRDPNEVMYSNIHFWFQRSTGKIGVTVFWFQSQDGRPHVLEYKKGRVDPGTLVDRLLFVARISHPDAELIVQNPVSGAILEYNSGFSLDKELDSLDNWIYRVIATNAGDEIKYLFTKEQYQRYCLLGNIGRENQNLSPKKVSS